MKEDTLQEIVLETNIDLSRRRETRKDIMLMLLKDYESSKKRIKQYSDDSSSDEEYVLISTLMGNITHGSNDWLIHNGASKHMMGFKELFCETIRT